MRRRRRVEAGVASWGDAAWAAAPAARGAEKPEVCVGDAIVDLGSTGAGALAQGAPGEAVPLRRGGSDRVRAEGALARGDKAGQGLDRQRAEGADAEARLGGLAEPSIDDVTLGLQRVV